MPPILAFAPVDMPRRSSTWVLSRLSCQSYNYIKNRFFRLKVKDYFELGVSFQKLTERETFVHLHLP